MQIQIQMPNHQRKCANYANRRDALYLQWNERLSYVSIESNQIESMWKPKIPRAKQFSKQITIFIDRLIKNYANLWNENWNRMPFENFSRILCINLNNQHRRGDTRKPFTCDRSSSSSFFRYFLFFALRGSISKRTQKFEGLKGKLCKLR